MNLLIISDRKSDLSALLSAENECVICTLAQAEGENLDDFDAIAVLGGVSDKSLVFRAVLRDKLERFADSGKKIFLEFVNSFRCVYSAQPTEIFGDRLVSCADISDKIQVGDLLDSHCNRYIRPHFLMPDTMPLMYYHKYTPAHDNIKLSVEDIKKGDIAFFENKNILSCCFRMCDYLKSALAPKERWDSLVDYICAFLGANKPKSYPENTLRTKKVLKYDFEQELDNCITQALNCLRRFLVTEDGANGIYEGLSHNILADGTRVLSQVIRTDCIGEAAGAFLLSGDKALALIADNMYSLCYGPMTVKDGEYKGMVRWSEEAWEVCYQDDVARAFIPALLCAYLGDCDKYVEPTRDILDFLCKTTCRDGLRPARTDVLNYLQSGESIYSLKDEPHGFASAHYNSWYSAFLLLGYLTTGNEEYKKIGITGLETLMSLYPDTVREHSETSELCRLIFPLALLYKTTGKKRHYDMLDRVFNDLQKYRHGSLGYFEWDTGYKATCFNNQGGECSLLAENGDAVADLLYSLNWLPLGFAFAFDATGEERFYTAWQDICELFIKAQLCDLGAWCRGIDLNRMEYFGIPHDVGWGPCCVETGWTVAEITMGMLVGKRFEK